MKGIFVLFGALLALHSATALKCFSCETPKGDVCEGKTQYTEMACEAGTGQVVDLILPGMQKVCLNFEATDENNKRHVLRGCSITGGPFNIDVCQMSTKVIDAVSAGKVKNIKCKTCTTDLCNA